MSKELKIRVRYFFAYSNVLHDPKRAAGKAINNRPIAIPRRKPKLGGGPIVWEYLVLDTNVLLGQLSALKIAFATYRATTNQNCAMVVPLSVLHELDRQKGGNHSNSTDRRAGLASYARQASQYLKDALMSGDGSVVGDRIPATKDDVHVGESHDDKIIQCALRFQRTLNTQTTSNKPSVRKGVVLLTEDVNMSVIAMSMGLPALTLADFIQKHVNKDEPPTNSSSSITTRKSLRTKPPAGESINSSAINRSSTRSQVHAAQQRRMHTQTPPQADSAQKRKRLTSDVPQANTTTTTSNTPQNTTDTLESSNKRKRLEPSVSATLSSTPGHTGDTQGAWLRVSGMPEFCTLEQLKDFFRKVDVSKPMFVSADRTNKGVGRVHIGPRFGGVTAALDRYDGQELLGKTINVRLETQAETAKYSTDPKVTRTSTGTQKPDSRTPAAGKQARTIIQEQNTAKTLGKIRGKTIIQEKATKSGHVHKSTTESASGVSVNSAEKWGSAEAQAALKNLLKASWELLKIALESIFILEYGADLWREVIGDWPTGVQGVCKIVKRQKCLSDYWPDVVLKECIPELRDRLNSLSDKYDKYDNDDAAQILGTVTLLCQYITTGLSKAQARSISTERDRILADVVRIRAMGGVVRAKTRDVTPLKESVGKGTGARDTNTNVQTNTNSDTITSTNTKPNTNINTSIDTNTHTNTDIHANVESRCGTALNTSFTSASVSFIVGNLEDFRNSTRVHLSGPIDIAQLSPEYYLKGTKDTQAAFAPFITDQLQLEFRALNGDGNVTPQTFRFLEQYSTRLSAVSQTLQQCMTVCEQTQSSGLPPPATVFASLAYALEDYLQTYSLLLPSPNPIPIAAMASGYQTYFGQACSTQQGLAQAYEYAQYFITETIALQQLGAMLHPI